MSDELLLDRLRRLLDDRPGVEEKRMVGGRSFLLRGRMVCGVNRGGLMVRVGADGLAEALSQPNVSPMMLGSKTLDGFVIVSLTGIASDGQLIAWIERGLDEAARK